MATWSEHIVGTGRPGGYGWKGAHYAIIDTQKVMEFVRRATVLAAVQEDRDGLAALEGKVKCIIERDGSAWSIDRGSFWLLESRNNGLLFYCVCNFWLAGFRLLASLLSCRLASMINGSGV